MTSPPRSSADPRASARDRWHAAVARVDAGSHPLGRHFADRTAGLVARAAPEWLEAYAEAALALRTRAGWRGERVAHEFVTLAPRAMAALAAGDVERWAALALRCSGTIDEIELLRALPDGIAAWDPGLRAAWLDAALAPSPVLGVVAYRDLPATLDRLEPVHRPTLLAAWGAAAAGPTGAALRELTPLLPALVGRVPEAARAHATGLAATVAARFPAGVPALLRSLPRLYEDAAPERIDEWAARGLALAAGHPLAGAAFFALGSRTSERVLAASATAVTLDEAQGVLRRIVHMLSGDPALPRASGRFTLRPPLEETPASLMIALPAAVDRLDTVEENLRLFGLAAALLAGRREFGTYATPALAVDALHDEDPSRTLEELCRLADGVRVAARLAATYPGVAADLAWASDTLLGARVAPADLLDLLFAVAVRTTPPPRRLPTWLAATARLALPALATLADPAATAADALAVARRLRPFFPDAGRNEHGLGMLPELVTLLLDAGPDDAIGGAEEAAPGRLAGVPEAAEDDAAPPALDDAPALLVDQELDGAGGGRPLDAEALRRLIETLGADALAQSRGDTAGQAGLYVTQLIGKRLAEAARSDAPAADAMPHAGRRTLPGTTGADDAAFLYDEWDHLIDDYRPRWCTLREVALPGDSGLYFDQALARHAELVPEVRRHFQRLRPERYRRVHGLEDGELIDLDAVVDARVQRRARQPASAKLYASRRREERDVATLFLVDLSASTDETAPGAAERIIDITKDALTIMAAALEEIGDLYAVYGFSGQGRDRVEVYPVKSFGERLTPAVQGRIGGLEPRGSTRMGTALRHALTRMTGVAAPSRHLILLSDGFPQDLDYGSDRASHTYGIRDTAAALREVQRAGVRPFCITVDLAGHDYLRQMCAPEQYLVIEAVTDLPRQLPKIYQRLVRAA